MAALAVLVAVATGTIASAGERTPIAGKPSAGTDPADASAARAAAGGAGSQPSEPAPIAAEPLTPRSVFVDDISLKITIKLDRGPTRVVNVDDPSRTVVVRYTVQPGAQFPWHSHLGPVVVNVVSGALTYVDAETCVERTYTAGQAFVDPGQGHVHTAFNPTSTPTVFVATFFAAPATGSLLIPSQRTASKQSEQARGNRSRSARFPSAARQLGVPMSRCLSRPEPAGNSTAGRWRETREVCGAFFLAAAYQRFREPVALSARDSCSSVDEVGDQGEVLRVQRQERDLMHVRGGCDDEVERSSARLTAAADDGRREPSPFARDCGVDGQRVERRLDYAEPL